MSLDYEEKQFISQVCAEDNAARKPRNPQRQAVLPECTEESFNAAGFSRYDFWNVWRAAHKSFIGEYKRLNP